MRKLLRKIILWAIDGALDPRPSKPPPPYDPATLDKIASEGRTGT